jgi:hypothetical protein
MKSCTTHGTDLFLQIDQIQKNSNKKKLKLLKNVFGGYKYEFYS